MSCTLRNDNQIKVAPYPTEEQIEEARETLKPPGILSNNYTKQGVKKVERTFVPSKNTSGLIGTTDPMHQTNYNAPVTDDKNLGKSYFNVTTTRVPMGTYDRINHVKTGYNQKLHRDDRAYAKLQGLQLHQEESERIVPVTSNAAYGAPNRLKLEQHSKQFGHVEICRHDFNRKSGVNLKEE